MGIGPSLENQRIDDLNGGAISGIGDLNGMIPDIKGGNGGISSAGQFDQFEQAIGKGKLHKFLKHELPAKIFKPKQVGNVYVS